MLAVLIMTMLGAVSGLGVCALTSIRQGGVERLSGGMECVEYGAIRVNGAISFLHVCEKAYQRAYQRGRDPPLRERDLGRRAWLEVKRKMFGVIAAGRGGGRC
jgi:hypothetical protein